jgi:hypothetical protein
MSKCHWCEVEHKPDVVGSHRTHGDLYRCAKCKSYYTLRSSRILEDPRNPESSDMPSMEPVFYGRGELGLANAICCKSHVDMIKLLFLDSVT